MSTNERLPEAREWVAFALSDLATASVILDHPAADDRHAGFLAQQAVEKLLKAAALLLIGDVRRTHDLETLMRLIPPGWSARKFWPDLADLSAWAGAGRYPDASPIPEGEARQAVKFAAEVAEAVLRDIRAAGFDV